MMEGGRDVTMRLGEPIMRGREGGRRGENGSVLSTERERCWEVIERRGEDGTRDLLHQPGP